MGTAQTAQTAQTARRSSKRNVSRSPRSPRRSRRSPFPRKPMHGGVSDREENYAGYERETDGGFYDKKHYLTYIKLADASYNALYVACRNLGASPQLAATVAQSKFVRWSEEEMQILFAKAFAQLFNRTTALRYVEKSDLLEEFLWKDLKKYADERSRRNKRKKIVTQTLKNLNLPDEIQEEIITIAAGYPKPILTRKRGTRRLTRTTTRSFIDELTFLEPRRNDFVWMNLGQRIYDALYMAARNNGLTKKQARHFCMTPWVTDNESRIFSVCVDTWTSKYFGLKGFVDDYKRRNILASTDDIDKNDLYEKVAFMADVWVRMAD